MLMAAHVVGRKRPIAPTLRQMMVSIVFTNFLVDTMRAKVAVDRKRRRRGEAFRAQAVAATRQPGVSVAAVALANGLNANLLRCLDQGERAAGSR